jgi:hypothetical protein
MTSDEITSIVFVHGLTGSTYGTWLNTQTGVHWPSALLAYDIGDARILTFDYDANVTHFWSPTSQNRINDHAENMLGALARLRERTDSVSTLQKLELKQNSHVNRLKEHRKIAFVAHSLGGLVTENALCLSKSSPESHITRIGDCTIGIVFLGTPHFGADLANWASLGTKVTRILAHQNQNIVSVLAPHSEVLSNIQKGFHGLLRRRRDEGAEISITCFFEELPLPIIGEVHPRLFEQISPNFH